MEDQLNQLETVITDIMNLIDKGEKISTELQIQTEIPKVVIRDATAAWIDNLSSELFGVNMPALPRLEFVLQYYKDLEK